MTTDELSRDWKHLQILLKREHILLSNLWHNLRDTQKNIIDFNLIMKDLQIVLSKADVLALNKKFYSVLEDKTVQEILFSIGNITVEEDSVTDEIHLEGFDNHVKSTKTYLRKEKTYMKLLSLLRRNPQLMTSMLEVAWNPEDRKKLSELFMFTIFGSWKNPSEELLRLNFIQNVILKDENEKIATKMYVVYTKIVGGRRFLDIILSNVIRKVIEKYDDSIDKNEIYTLCYEILDNCLKYIHSLPDGIIHLNRMLLQKGKESKFLKYFFHDFLIASIVCPESIGLFVVEDIDISQRKICANIGKEISYVIQGTKEDEPYLIMKEKIQNIMEEFKNSEVKIEEMDVEKEYPKAIVLNEKDLYFIHGMLQDLMDSRNNQDSKIEFDPEILKISEELGSVSINQLNIDRGRVEVGTSKNYKGYLVYYIDKNNYDLHKYYRDIAFPFIPKYHPNLNQILKEEIEEKERLTDDIYGKVHMILIKIDLLNHTKDLKSNLEKLRIKYSVDRLFEISTCVNQVINDIKDLKEDDFQKIYNYLIEEWEKRSLQRKIIEKKIENISIFKKSLERELNIQLETRKYLASIFWVRQIINENQSSIKKLKEKLNLNENIEFSKVPFYIRTFYRDELKINQLMEKKFILDEYNKQLTERQLKLFPETPNWIFNVLLNYIHSKLYLQFILETDEDLKLFKIMNKYEPDDISDWWNNQKFEGSEIKFENKFKDETLLDSIELFKFMLSLKNPFEKLIYLKKIYDSVTALFKLCSVQRTSENLNKTLRYIIWKSKPKSLLGNMQYITLFNSIDEDDPSSKEIEKVISDFEFCTKAIQMISELLSLE